MFACLGGLLHHTGSVALWNWCPHCLTPLATSLCKTFLQLCTSVLDYCTQSTRLHYTLVSCQVILCLLYFFCKIRTTSAGALNLFSALGKAFPQLPPFEYACASTVPHIRSCGRDSQKSWLLFAKSCLRSCQKYRWRWVPHLLPTRFLPMFPCMLHAPAACT